jgi:hypothetical protein
MRGIVRLAAISVALAGTLAITSDQTRAAVSRNRLASNRLASNRLASNRLASNRLASNALSSTRLDANLATAEILSTPDGRDVYSYIISCALPEGTTIQANVPGAENTAPPDTNYTCSNEVCSFSGALGLADYWVKRRLDPQGQRWITACLLARVNANNIAEAISLRGLAPQLSASGDELVLYGAQEGAFYGNLFTDGDDIDWNACRGADAQVAWNQARDCTQPDPLHPGLTMCGFKDGGECTDYTPEFPSPYACRTSDEGIFGDCHTAAGDGRWPGLRPYREVITTYVAP